MKHARSFKIPAITAGILSIFLALPASAQYIWLDKNNVKNYSDKPPPATIPASRILKTPRNKTAIPAPTAAQASASAAANGAPTAQQKPPAAKSEADKKKEQAEKDKKAAEQAKQAEAKAKNCERAREHQRTLSSGQRLMRTNEKGERVVLSDEQRAQEQQEAQRVLDECQ